ncbi:hypothetical protein [Coralloluteibacterium thermophilus]|uniref:DUF1134 domain-containing protein n=1 Tax=Coralloluteibacterium thermophilum TaxID=2707049 RepID=A0ABV9NHU5_9GAMM
MRMPTLVLLAAALFAASASARANEVKCRMTFSLSGWSAFYKTASGNGTIRCDNGQSMAVRISAKGGGLTFGRSSIDNGVGEFSGVVDIGQTLGNYASAEAHAGAVRSSKAMVVTKGEVSLALSGVGRGWDLGVGFGRFTIERAR